jgi:hypothetical protein
VASSFAFDTRDGSWKAAVNVGFESSNLNATLAMSSGTECTETGTTLSGDISINFGEMFASNIIGRASGVKRCGEHAKAGVVLITSIRLTLNLLLYLRASV